MLLLLAGYQHQYLVDKVSSLGARNNCCKIHNIMLKNLQEKFNKQAEEQFLNITEQENWRSFTQLMNVNKHYKNCIRRLEDIIKKQRI